MQRSSSEIIPGENSHGILRGLSKRIPLMASEVTLGRLSKRIHRRSAKKIYGFFIFYFFEEMSEEIS